MPNTKSHRHLLPLFSAMAISLLAHLVVFLLVGYFFWTNIAKLLPKQQKSPIVISTIKLDEAKSQPQTEPSKSELPPEKTQAEDLTEKPINKKEDEITKTLVEPVKAVTKKHDSKKYDQKLLAPQKKAEKPDTFPPTTEKRSDLEWQKSSREMSNISESSISDTVTDDESIMGQTKEFDIENLENDYLQALLRELAKHKKYPDSARRRGLEGDVIVTFTVLEDGTISRTNIEKSSGWSILDRAAIRSLKRLGRFKPIPTELNRDAWAFLVTIHFSLE
ncbi:MAG: energy transducer TonB [Deltaproteobacteria bacterium]|jgi:protein TonB|nr:energy transducer TonB [Deltaproteobacteria bacterium]MBW2519690.1 energy transducer TonB [Deltaproteobacteria bacterium]